MSYQVLARKLRPKAFSELIGQEHVSQTLLNALKNDRLPHALLFTGARGVGKTSAARILAKSLRCPNAVDFVPCGKCSDCEDIAAGRAVDVMEVDGASNNSVDNIRELRETVGYMPAHGKYKVYIIDEVHMLSTSAFNALLKTLEEPPSHVVFIFATTEVQKIPVTILSRCQRFDFRRIPIRKIADYLKEIVAKENVQADEKALWLIAQESEGSMRDSQSLLDQVISFCQGSISYEQVIEILGLTDRTLLNNTLKALVERDASVCLSIIDKVFQHGYDPKQFAQDLLEHIRNLMIVKVAGGKKDLEFLDLPDQEIEELGAFAKDLTNEDIHLLFDMTLKGVNDVVRSQGPRVVLEMLLLRLSQAPRLQSIEDLLEHGGGGNEPQLPKAAPQAPTPPRAAPTLSMQQPQRQQPQQQAAAPRPQAPVQQQQQPSQAEPPQQQPQTTVPQVMEGTPAARWVGLIEVIKKEKPLLGAKLEYAAVEKIDDGLVSIVFRKEQEFVYSQVSQKDVVDQLVGYVGKYWGKPRQVEVKLHVDPDKKAPLSPIAEREQVKAEGDAAVRKQVEAHPLVKEVQKQFNAPIGSIKETK